MDAVSITENLLIKELLGRGFNDQQIKNAIAGRKQLEAAGKLKPVNVVLIGMQTGGTVIIPEEKQTVRKAVRGTQENFWKELRKF